MAKATLTISSKNYSSWSLRGWLLARFAGLEFKEVMVPPDDADARKELLLLSPSILVPCLTPRRHQGLGHAGHRRIPERDQAAQRPAAGRPRGARALPRDLRRDAFGIQQPALGAADEPEADVSRHKVWARAQGDIERITTIWRECLATYGGPFLFGKRSMADAMYAPVVTRFVTYDVKLDKKCAAYGAHILAMPEMIEWTAAAKLEPEEIDELDMEF